MALMRIRPSVTSENATRTLSSSVAMESVFPSCGTVTSTTTVETIRMSRHICVAIETVALAGRNVLQDTITAAFPVGYSAMARTTAGTTRTSHTVSYVPSVTIPETSSVKMIDAFRFVGDVVILFLGQFINFFSLMCFLFFFRFRR